MKPCNEIKESWCLEIDEKIGKICRMLDDKIDKKESQMKARIKKSELETKMAQELKLNAELTKQLSEISRRDTELDRVCASLESRLTIADSDRQRLENAKETYQIAKELTGIRFDFEAPPDVAKGYIKSEPRHLLQAFEQGPDAGALWERLGQASAPAWARLRRDNRPRGKIN